MGVPCGTLRQYVDQVKRFGKQGEEVGHAIADRCLGRLQLQCSGNALTYTGDALGKCAADNRANGTFANARCLNRVTAEDAILISLRA
ncbi:hypothetical protein [Serratia sp. TSA_198.1]|uniref:hypothetical protein n=1 Tax=Serratia sp. TSA_198.1 TaxID=3415664 RepID=UPI004046063A